MKQFLALFISLISMAYSSASVAEMKVIVNVPYSTPDSNLYITGNFDHCNWDPQCKKLEPSPAKGQILSYFYVIKSAGPVEFKITRGDWNKQAANYKGEALENQFLNIPVNDANKGVPFIFNIVNWTDHLLWESGEVIEWDHFYSANLDNSRKIWIWIPPNYSADSKPYPTVYMHDGENIFNNIKRMGYKTSRFDHNWAIDSTMAKLTTLTLVKPAIVVGVSSISWKGRFEEYDPFIKTGQRYMKLIVEELIPAIEANFNASKDRNDRFAMGSSMGALISLGLLNQYSEKFSKAACLSFFNRGYDPKAISKYFKTFKNKYPVKLYLDHGQEETGYQNWNAPLSEYLSTDTPVLYRTFPHSLHSEEHWARRAELPIQFLLQK